MMAGEFSYGVTAALGLVAVVVLFVIIHLLSLGGKKKR
jgi:hypothetical protein